jgi:hypothetical protein
MKKLVALISTNGKTKEEVVIVYSHILENIRITV